TTRMDAEPELHRIDIGAATATFVYDGDGQQVRGTGGGITTTYISNYYEWNTNTGLAKKYYYADGQRVAMRDNATLSFILTDHLGSTSLTATSTGVFSTEVRYRAWGPIRYTSGTTATTFLFTGQRFQSEIGLYYYG